MKCVVVVTLEGRQGYLRIPGVQIEDAQAMIQTAHRHGQRAHLIVNLGRPCPTARENGPSLRPQLTGG